MWQVPSTNLAGKALMPFDTDFQSTTSPFGGFAVSTINIRSMVTSGPPDNGSTRRLGDLDGC